MGQLKYPEFGFLDAIHDFFFHAFHSNNARDTPRWIYIRVPTQPIQLLCWPLAYLCVPKIHFPVFVPALLRVPTPWRRSDNVLCPDNSGDSLFPKEDPPKRSVPVFFLNFSQSETFSCSSAIRKTTIVPLSLPYKVPPESSPPPTATHRGHPFISQGDLLPAWLPSFVSLQ